MARNFGSIKWVKPKIRHGIPVKKYHWKVWNPENFILGEQTDIGADTNIYAQYRVEIGYGVQIGQHCDIYSANTENGKYGPVRIGRNAIIGAHTMVFPNVTIGEDAKIGANCVINASVGKGSVVKTMSLVQRDVPDGCVARGIPARIIKKP